MVLKICVVLYIYTHYCGYDCVVLSTLITVVTVVILCVCLCLSVCSHISSDHSSLQYTAMIRISFARYICSRVLKNVLGIFPLIITWKLNNQGGTLFKAHFSVRVDGGSG